MGLPIVLFKHDADRRHHIPKMRLRETNWRQYEAGLRRRGSLTRCREAAKAAAVFKIRAVKNRSLSHER
jgi:hypothetical protein